MDSLSRLPFSLAGLPVSDIVCTEFSVLADMDYRWLKWYILAVPESRPVRSYLEKDGSNCYQPGDCRDRCLLGMSDRTILCHISDN
jgi:hypothetical protein